ncbi:MAG: type II toxin-antitoxin system RelE/ParE family toxin [Pseudomonas sp.]|nr:MAG: type II toxin-antitoxin system RelE/ParE family toxin [Pseudomonas sp.]
MVWRIELADTARKELAKLDKPVVLRIRAFLRERLAELDDPRSIGDALKGSELGMYWKYRVGDYRIVAKIEDQIVRVLILKIGNRREVYKQ